MLRRRPEGGFTILELAISIAVVAMLIVLLVPTLQYARAKSFRDGCADHQRQLGTAWFGYLEDHDNQFPQIEPLRAAWNYAGVRFSSVDDTPFIDYDRPLNQYLGGRHFDLLQCPGDSGISGESPEAGTHGRTVYRAYGTSFRAVIDLFNAPLQDPEAEARGLRRDEILYPPSRVVLMGDPTWHETRESTGRHADWHGEAGGANMLYLDGSVRYAVVQPKGRMRASVFEPLMRQPRAEDAADDVPITSEAEATVKPREPDGPDNEPTDPTRGG